MNEYFWDGTLDKPYDERYSDDGAGLTGVRRKKGWLSAPPIRSLHARKCPKMSAVCAKPDRLILELQFVLAVGQFLVFVLQLALFDIPAAALTFGISRVESSASTSFGRFRGMQWLGKSIPVYGETKRR